MTFIHEAYYSSFKTKLHLAHELNTQYGESLKIVPEISSNLALLEFLAQSLSEHMGSLNFAQFCSDCSAKPGGGCCSVAMSEESDAILLLINLLAGHQVTIQRDDNFECYLLGAFGCILRYKPVFCLNYNCHTIKSLSESIPFGSYLTTSAKLLQCQWVIEKCILDRLKKIMR